MKESVSFRSFRCLASSLAVTGRKGLRSYQVVEAVLGVVGFEVAMLPLLGLMVVGLSDHTPGIAVSVAAVALGAAIIEKHFTLRRADGGPDAAFSLEPDELAALAEGCRTAWAALGRVNYEREPSEAQNIVFRRSPYVVEDITARETFTPHNVRSIRPGYGLPLKHLPKILGRRANRSLARGTPLGWSCVDWSE